VDTGAPVFPCKNGSGSYADIKDVTIEDRLYTQCIETEAHQVC